VPDPTPEQVEAWVRAGLLEPGAERAAERLELLTWLAERGVPHEAMVAAHRAGDLTAVAGDLELRPGPRWTLAEVADRLGTSPEWLVAIRRAIGLPKVGADERAYTEGDLAMLRAFETASSLFSRDELTHLSRVMGSAMRRIADAAGEMFLLDVEAPMVRRGRTELELARSSLTATQLAGAAIEVFGPLFRAHLEESTRTSRLARRASHAVETVPLAIGFVDLSGYTSQAERLAPSALLELVLAFEACASDVVTDHGGRVVKLIGDEVMFTVLDAPAACSVALELLTAMEPWGRPRGGLAYGSVVAHGGDVYGETVNRASRMADTAIPGEVLVDASVVEHAGAHRFEPAGRRQLKGFSEPMPLWSLLPPV